MAAFVLQKRRYKTLEFYNVYWPERLWQINLCERDC